MDINGTESSNNENLKGKEDIHVWLIIGLLCAFVVAIILFVVVVILLVRWKRSHKYEPNFSKVTNPDEYLILHCNTDHLQRSKISRTGKHKQATLRHGSHPITKSGDHRRRSLPTNQMIELSARDLQYLSQPTDSQRIKKESRFQIPELKEFDLSPQLQAAQTSPQKEPTTKPTETPEYGYTFDKSRNKFTHGDNFNQILDRKVKANKTEHQQVLLDPTKYGCPGNIVSELNSFRPLKVAPPVQSGVGELNQMIQLPVTNQALGGASLESEQEQDQRLPHYATVSRASTKKRATLESSRVFTTIKNRPTSMLLSNKSKVFLQSSSHDPNADIPAFTHTPDNKHLPSTSSPLDIHSAKPLGRSEPLLGNSRIEDENPYSEWPIEDDGLNENSFPNSWPSKASHYTTPDYWNDRGYRAPDEDVSLDLNRDGRNGLYYSQPDLISSCTGVTRLNSGNEERLYEEIKENSIYFDAEIASSYSTAGPVSNTASVIPSVKARKRTSYENVLDFPQAMNKPCSKHPFMKGLGTHSRSRSVDLSSEFVQPVVVQAGSDPKLSPPLPDRPNSAQTRPNSAQTRPNSAQTRPSTSKAFLESSSIQPFLSVDDTLTDTSSRESRGDTKRHSVISIFKRHPSPATKETVDRNKKPTVQLNKKQKTNDKRRRSVDGLVVNAEKVEAKKRNKRAGKVSAGDILQKGYISSGNAVKLISNEADLKLAIESLRRSGVDLTNCVQDTPDRLTHNRSELSAETNAANIRLLEEDTTLVENYLYEQRCVQ